MSVEIPVVITRTEYERLLELKSSFAVLEKRLQAAEAAAKPATLPARFEYYPDDDMDYRYGMDIRGEAEQRIKIKTKDGFVCISDKAYPQSHDRIRTACSSGLTQHGLFSDAGPHIRVSVEYRTYGFVGRCKKTGLRMFEEL